MEYIPPDSGIICAKQICSENTSAPCCNEYLMLNTFILSRCHWTIWLLRESCGQCWILLISLQKVSPFLCWNIFLLKNSPGHWVISNSLEKTFLCFVSEAFWKMLKTGKCYSEAAAYLTLFLTQQTRQTWLTTTFLDTHLLWLCSWVHVFFFVLALRP